MPQSKSRSRRSRSRRSKKRRSKSRSSKRRRSKSRDRSKSRGRRTRRSKRSSVGGWLGSSGGLLGLAALIYIMSHTKGPKRKKTKHERQIEKNNEELQELKKDKKKLEKKIGKMKQISIKNDAKSKSYRKKVFTEFSNLLKKIKTKERANKNLLIDVIQKHKFPEQKEEKKEEKKG